MTNEFDPMAVSGSPGIGDNSGDVALAADAVKAELFKNIESLYEEATHWADGSEIENDKQHDAVTAIRNALHELGRKADEIRAEEKKPHDDAAKKVQAEFNPYIQKDKGKVDRAKKCLDTVLAKWRVAEQRRKDEIARREREEAEAELRKAQEAIRESRGNLLAREDAEEALSRAKQSQTFARRAERDANTGTGLRTVRRIEFADPKDREAGMDWAFSQDAERFFGLAIDMAREHYNATKRAPTGFAVVEEKVAGSR